MKQITQQEFEGYVRDLIDGKTNKTAIAKKLETSIKKVNYMIDDLAKTNPELFMEFFKKQPYAPRNTEVDPEALAIEVIRYGRKDVAHDIGISIRTITRTIDKLKTINPTLYELYRKRIRKMDKVERKEFKKAVEREAEKIGYDLSPARKSIEDRLNEINEILSKFEALVDSGMTYRDASRKLGYSSNATIWLMYQDKKKIELALETHKKLAAEKRNEAKEYREKMRIKKSGSTQQVSDKSKTGEKEKQDKSQKKDNTEPSKKGKGRDD